MNEEQNLAMTSHVIDYEAIKHVLEIEAPSKADKERFLLEELPYTWVTHYERMTQRPHEILNIPYNESLYYYDHYTGLEMKELVPYSETDEDRVVGVIGRSITIPRRAKHTSAWLKKLIGSTEERWGPQFDKGHYMASSIGGGEQLNIFAQRRDINRGWSARGRVFREMERYCAENPGTLCFHRPIYLDESARPAALDFGLIMNDGNLWVERFENQEIPGKDGSFECLMEKGKELNSWVTRLKNPQ